MLKIVIENGKGSTQIIGTTTEILNELLNVLLNIYFKFTPFERTMFTSMLKNIDHFVEEAEAKKESGKC